MSGIQSSIGLVSGVDIGNTVSQLVAIAGRPRAALIARANRASQQQAAITDLTTLVVGLELSAKRLGGENSVFKSVKVTSTHGDLISASSSGSPKVGSYSLTPVRKAQTNQLLSQQFAATDSLLGAGSISFQNGGHIDRSVDLATLNGGRGVDRGQIRITDRSGTSGVIDLRYAKTTTDVIDAINNQTSVNVRAELDGDRIKLVDGTGQTAANLRVQNVGSDTTATDLGLSNINVAADQANGNDVYYLSRGTRLSELNNGNGVNFNSSTEAFSIALADGGTAVSVDLGTARSLGDVLDKINAADPSRVRAQVSASGDGLEIIDLTSGSGTFAVTNGTGSTAATDLGIAGTGSGGTLSGSRIAAGLDTVLLSKLNGGKGLGQLGNLVLTDRSGNSATIDLSAAQTLDEVLEAINSASGISIEAKVGATGGGLELIDRSGGSGDLVVGDGSDGLETATKLKLEGSYSQDSAISKPLNLQSVNRSTLLEDFRGGVAKGSFLLTDSSGATSAVNLTVLDAKDIGDVLDAINSLSIGVEAQINDEGNGIKLVDTAGGTGQLTIKESGNGTAATDLGISGTSTEVNGVKQLVGSQRTTLEITDTDTLDTVIDKINQSGAGVQAARFFDGEGYRLNLISDTPGNSGRIWLDSTLETSFSVVAQGRDALLQYGPPGSDASLLLSSSSNTFNNIIPEVEFTLNQSSLEEVTISVEKNNETVTNAVQLFVDQFNKIFDKVGEYTKFSSSTTASGTKIETGLLFGTSEALRIEQELTRLATGSINGAGSLGSLREVGIEYDFETKKLTFDKAKFAELYNQDPAKVAEFFEKETNGVSARFQQVTDRLAGIDNSLLLNRNNALQRQIETFNEQIENKTTRLNAYQNRLLSQFFKMEETLSRLQENQTALNALQIIPPIGSNN